MSIPASVASSRPTTIVYPSGINWFHEAIARDVHDELIARGVAAQLLSASQLLEMPDAAGDLLIVNFRESAVQLSGPGCSEPTDAAIDRLSRRMRECDRRILLNLDSIHTHWFGTQLAMCHDWLTDIFDLNLVRQTESTHIGGCRYTWVPECLTERQMREIPPYAPERPIPWAMIGHATQSRAQVVDELTQRLGRSGFIFLPELRPWRADGDQNLSAAGLARVLSQLRYYVWSSHHDFAYHEAFRALHAIRNGAIPVKLDVAFAAEFTSLPWVYRDVDHLLTTIDRLGPRRMFEQAVEFIVSRGTLGQALAEALQQLSGMSTSSPAGTIGKYR